ncbi:MAG: tetratricopeptide repeat protein, partial [bacterium]
VARNNLGAVLFKMGQVDQAMVWIESALQYNPAFADAYLSLSNLFDSRGQSAEAIATLRRGLTHAPEDPRLAAQLAWLLATTPQASLRQGQEAVRLAQTACDKTNFQDPQALDALAAALDETGRFSRAAETAQQALQLPILVDHLELTAQIQNRLNLYKSKKPFRQHRTTTR